MAKPKQMPFDIEHELELLIDAGLIDPQPAKVTEAEYQKRLSKIDVEALQEMQRVRLGIVILKMVEQGFRWTDIAKATGKAKAFCMYYAMGLQDARNSLKSFPEISARIPSKNAARIRSKHTDDSDIGS